MYLALRHGRLDLSRPQIMGILNVTPDSFSDGGLYLQRDAALRRAEQMIAQGAALIDIGGESTRPGAASVTLQEELDRVCPIVEAVAGSFDTIVSVDTSQPQVMQNCAALGAAIWNDIRALQVPGAWEMALQLHMPVCLMHMQGTPRTMQDAPHYTAIVQEVRDFLTTRAAALTAQGLARESIIIDPGFGFGKTTQDNYTLLSHLQDLCSCGYIVLAALSRKSMIGRACQIAAPALRISGSVAGALLAVTKGARIVRVHDVAETRQALDVYNMMTDCPDAP